MEREGSSYTDAAAVQKPHVQYFAIRYFPSDEHGRYDISTTLIVFNPMILGAVS
jgi:hypothetical protein